MTPLDLVKLQELMELTAGRPDIMVGLIDGPVVISHSGLAGDNIREVPGEARGACSQAASAACRHGTFVAGILSAKRGSSAPAICPGCTLLVRPVFYETELGDLEQPSAEPRELAAAILSCIEAGARLLNLSLALMQSSAQAKRTLVEALDRAARRGVIIVAAAGNQATIGGTVITSHPWVIPVAACDLSGKPLEESNLGHSIGRHGLRAPGVHITSLGSEGEPLTLGGTSAAAPFVTGAIALVWSQFPSASAARIRSAFVHADARARTNVTPPLLNAWAAYQVLLATHSKR
jgi:subtilisin family serine protease